MLPVGDVGHNARLAAPQLRSLFVTITCGRRRLGGRDCLRKTHGGEKVAPVLNQKVDKDTDLIDRTDRYAVAGDCDASQ